ncbi:MAG TPA: DUF4190 domain-containing protein [Verrucomicrobiota bacterium]|nr:hypothetical protein [Verrucomicrobiales bacterium]HRI15661.1 DUF4190 domain-containing protein [Verrucomicrobiota bacterium]
MNPSADSPAPEAPQSQSRPAAKLSLLAVFSLLFGILGCTGLGALAGIAFGAIALVRINNSEGRLKGQGLAITGIIVSGLMLLLVPVLAGMLLPALAKAKAKAQIIASVNQVKQIGLAARIYETDHEGKFPLAANWNDTLRPLLGEDADKILRRPAARESSCGYGYNALVAGLLSSKVDPATVMFFELEFPRDNAVGGEELLRQPEGRGDRVVVGLADGSVVQLRAENLSELRWQP